MKKQQKKIKKREVKITGISEPKQSKYGGKYRMIFADGYEPASLYEKMKNYKSWEPFIQPLLDGYKLYTHAIIKKTRDGRRFIDCDFIPEVIAVSDKDNKEVKI